MANILVTCVGSGVGQSVVDSLFLTKRNNIIGCDANRNVYAYKYCTKFYTVPSIYADNYLEFILEICKNNDINLVIPGHDHELFLFSQERKRFENHDIKLMVSKPDLIKISRNKYDWYSFFNVRGCSVVPTMILADFKSNPDESFFPAIIKPVGGSASQGISIAFSMNDIHELSNEDIIQPYLLPKKDDVNYIPVKSALNNKEFIQRSEISVQLVFSSESILMGVFISRNSLKNGIPVFVEPIVPDDFDYFDEIMKFVSVCEEEKVIGPVNLQGRITEQGMYFFEMNMRFTGITGNRAYLGFNEVDYLVSNFLNLPAHLGSYAKRKLGVRQVACTTIPCGNDSTKKSICVLGAGSSFGSEFINELLKNDNFDEIYVISRESSVSRYEKIFSNPRVEIVLSSDAKVETVYSKSDILVNFIGALADKPEIEIYDAILYQYDQVNKIMNSNIPLIINVSSQSVYNQSINSVKCESDEINIQNAYSFQKVLGEQFFSSLSDASPCSKVVSLRFSRILGAHFSEIKVKGFFAKIIESILFDNEITIQNPLNNINIIDLRDAVDSIFHVINNEDKLTNSMILNVGGSNVTLREYCEDVVSVLGENGFGGVKFLESDLVSQSSIIDISRIVDLGWKPKHTIKNTIEAIIQRNINYK